MLKLHFLNVGQGSSAVVEFTRDESKHFGLIDSNCPVGDKPRALQKLRDLGCNHLSFVALSHPHDDHYGGLIDVLNAYQGSISELYTFPMGNLTSNKGRMTQLKTQLARLFDIPADDPKIRKARLEFVQILQWADANNSSRATEWRECDGEENYVAPPGFGPEVEIKTILPPKRVKGSWISALQTGSFEQPGALNVNELSLAISISYAGIETLIGGDGTKQNWMIRKRYRERRGAVPSALVVNLPHHGSKLDCDKEVIDELFASAGTRYAITSAGGVSHPFPENIKYLANNGIKPYCTNLMPICGNNVVRLQPSQNIAPELVRWIREAAEQPFVMQACQGDITVCIDPQGSCKVMSSTGNVCWLRGDLDNLISGI